MYLRILVSQYRKHKLVGIVESFYEFENLLSKNKNNLSKIDNKRISQS